MNFSGTEANTAAPFRAKMAQRRTEAALSSPLDRVLHGQFEESLVAAECGCQSEKGRVVAWFPLIAVIVSAVAGQPGHGPFDDPPSTAESFAGVDALAGDADADALAPQPFPQVRNVVRLIGAVGWNRSRGIRVPCGNGMASASARGCRGCWPRTVRPVKAVRTRRTGHASWNRAYPGPRGSDLQVRPFFGADVGGVEDRAGEVDEVAFIQQLENLLMQPTPEPRTGPDNKTAMHGRLRRPETRWQRSPGAAADEYIDDRGEHRLIIEVRDSTALRPHPSRRQQRAGKVPQPIRNDPSPTPTPHAQHNSQLTM